MSYADPGAIAPHLTVVPRPLRFVREPFASLEPDSSAWLIKGLVPAKGYGFLAGPSQSRKSFLALEWSLRVAGGEPVLGHRTRQAGVVYIASEGASGVRKRVAAWRTRNGSKERAFDMIAQAPDLRSEVDIEDLISVLASAAADYAANGERLGLVVIDTLAASMPGGDENNGGDMSRLLSNAQRIGEATGAFILIVSHTGKDETRGLRGWSGQFAGADCVIMLTRDEETSHSQGVVKKQKDGEDGERFAFALDYVPLGFDEDGDEFGSCVVAYTEVPEAKVAGRRQRPLKADESALLRAIQYLTDHGPSAPLPASIQGAQAWQKGVSRDDVKARALATGFEVEGEKADSLRKRLGRALLELAARDLIRREGDLIWLLEGGTA